MITNAKKLQVVKLFYTYRSSKFGSGVSGKGVGGKDAAIKRPWMDSQRPLPDTPLPNLTSADISCVMGIFNINNGFISPHF